MLNEIFQVAEALEKLKLVVRKTHSYIEPLGNSPLFVIRITETGQVGDVDILLPAQACLLQRIRHGSTGTTFPGFNLPSPVWDLTDVPVDHLQQFRAGQKNRKLSGRQRFDCLCALKSFTKLRDFTQKEEGKFNRIFGEFVTMLVEDFASAPPELVSFTQLLAVLGKSKASMKSFVSQIVDQITRGDRDIDLPYVEVAETFLVGRGTLRGVSTKRTTAIFLDLDSPPAQARPVAHQVTCELINAHLLQVRPGRGYAKGGKGAQKKEGFDAFTGTLDELETSFPEPKVQVLRPPNLKLFSANSETGCLGRYGLIDSDIFPVSKESAARMQNAIKYLAGAEEQRGKTWYPIPSNLTEKKKPKADLLVAYLENEPDSRAAIAEMFGGQCETFSDADFEARTQPVFAAIEANLKTMPDLNVRLLILSSLDPGRKQLGLERRFRVADVIRAAKDWQTGARNAPTVSVEFHDKVSKQFMFRGLTTPFPLELASTINRVWSSDAKDGFKSSFQRAFSASDAFDIFLAGAPLVRRTADAALGLLIQRMSVVLAGLGAVKTTGKWIELSDTVRWQSLKAVALFGILLRQRGDHKENFMQEPIYQLGRLLALADRLHFQYCKFVRTSDEKRKEGKVDSPTELLGNSLFNFALEQPVSALARLAERIKPYKGWADTYDDEDSGLVHWFVCQMSETEKWLDVNRLLPRMTDLEKAKLLLGYLADLKNIDTQGQ